MLHALLSAFLINSQVILVAAEEVPQFDYAVSCRAVAQLMPVNLEACYRDELNARKNLSATWIQFTAGDRQNCISATTDGGRPSYVELLTCLQLARDARKLPKVD